MITDYDYSVPACQFVEENLAPLLEETLSGEEFKLSILSPLRFSEVQSLGKNEIVDSIFKSDNITTH